MKIKKVTISGGSAEYSVDSIVGRIVCSLSILLLGKFSGNLGRSVLTDVNITFNDKETQDEFGTTL